ncbi:MAG: hypothetical protein A2W03_05310 [Candidatus Aminicenantes bacterium RBG_16_63_16]|nr:MAG: hypothetical protein A2W03_05310 [Candidatus Aminicenantes bacterium RBG_16_63_16]
MEKKSWGGLLLVLLAMVLIAGPGWSQVKAIAEMTCDFNVEDTTFPAGKYNLRQLSGDHFVVDSPDLKVATVFMTTPGGLVKGGTPNAYELVFKIYGDRYFLAALRIMGDPNEHNLIPHSIEKELMAKGAPKTEVVRCIMAPGPPK